MLEWLEVVSYWNSTSNHNLYPVRIDFIKLYLIEILHQTTTCWYSCCWRWVLYLIEILHQTTTPVLLLVVPAVLYLIEILHQTTTTIAVIFFFRCCILLKFYIKPQRRAFFYRSLNVVSYWNSTSNHNAAPAGYDETRVVSYWNSTSNHNGFATIFFVNKVVSYWNSTSNHNLYPVRIDFIKLYLIEILHQTTTTGLPRLTLLCCILLKFYIKPQHGGH